MRIEVLERLIDRLFGDGAEAPPADAADMAEFSAHLAQPGRPPVVQEGDPAEPLAAWLDGALDGAARDAFEADLAHAPAERHDLESAQSFLDSVTAHPLAAPADLVEAAVAALPAGRARQPDGALQSFARWLRGRRWTLGAAGGAVAVAFSVVLVISANLESPATRAVLPHIQPAMKFKARGAGDMPSGQPAAATGAVVTPAGPPAPASPVAAPLAAPEPAKAAPAPSFEVPDEAAAQHMLEQYRAQQMDMEGAMQGAKPAMSVGASAGSAQQDPCAPVMADDSKAKTGATASRGAAAGGHRNADCDRGFADKGFGSGPYVGTAPADAAAMPARPASPMEDNALGSSRPVDSGPQ